MLLVIQFLYPTFLYGLFFLAVPVLLHLFSFKKYKKVYFSNFNFLESLQQQKKNSSRLKNILLLLLRLLAITALVIAFANPYIATRPAAVQNTQTPVLIYLDNSFSMTNSGTKGNLFEEAKKHVYDIVNAYPAGTTFMLLTNEQTETNPLTKDQVFNRLSILKTTPATKKLSQIYQEARACVQNHAATLFILSDFQKANCDFQQIPADLPAASVLLVLKPENSSNLYIKDVSFEEAFHKKNQTDKIRITVANVSDKEFNNIPLTLTINGKKKSIQKINIPAQGEQVAEINYLNTEDGFYKGIVEVADFPVVFDNQFYFSYGIHGKAHILYLTQEEVNPCFEKLFSDTSVFHFTHTPVQQTANVNLNRYQLVILDGLKNSSSGFESALEEYLIHGGNLFFLPDNPLSCENYNRFLGKVHAPVFGTADSSAVISHIETQASLFRDVFEQPDEHVVLPSARQFFSLSLTPYAERLLSDKQGNTLLAAQTFGKGSLYLSAFSFAPENSDMVYHPLFVPLMVNMAWNLHTNLNTSYFLGTNQTVNVNPYIHLENSRLRICNEDKTFEFIPEIRKNFSGDLVLVNTSVIPNAGLYELWEGDKLADVLAWNYNRQESEMEFCSEEELQQHFPQAHIENIKTSRLDRNSDLIREIVLEDNNRYLAPWLLAAAILLLLLEQIVWRKKLN